MEQILTAFATDDGHTFTERHFGDSSYFDLYEINLHESRFVKRIINQTGDGEIHSDPRKAKGIAASLTEEYVQVLVSKKFGANINRMKKKFVCLLMTNLPISENVEIIRRNLDKVICELEKGEARNYINLRTVN